MPQSVNVYLCPFEVLPGEFKGLTRVVEYWFGGVHCTAFFHLLVDTRWSCQVACPWRWPPLRGGPCPTRSTPTCGSSTLAPYGTLDMLNWTRCCCPEVDITCPWDPVAEDQSLCVLDSDSNMQRLGKKDLFNWLEVVLEESLFAGCWLVQGKY